MFQSNNLDELLMSEIKIKNEDKLIWMDVCYFAVEELFLIIYLIGMSLLR